MTNATSGNETTDDLAAVVDELQAEIQTVTGRDLPLLKAAIRGLLSQDVDSIHGLPDAGRAVGNQLSDFESRLTEIEQQLATMQSVGDGQTSKEEKIARVLAYAENKSSTSQSKVSVSATEIKGCAGVSRRYAYDLLEEIAEIVTGVRLREAKRVQTGSGLEQKRKALLVDCDVVHTDTRVVNKHTTPIGAQGGENES